MFKRFIFLLFTFTIVFALKITLPSTIISEDNKFTLRDIIPELKKDKILAYIPPERGIFFKSSQLAKQIEYLLNVYFQMNEELDISFESSEIFVKFEDVSTKLTYDSTISTEQNLNIENFIVNKLKENFEGIKVENVEINNRGISDISTVTEINFNRVRNKIYGNLKVVLKNHSKRIIFFNALVHKYDYVYVAKNPLPPKSILTGNLVEKIKMDVFSLNFDPIPVNDNEIVKYESARYIKKGEVLTVLNTRRLPDVKRGQIIPLYVKVGNILVTTKVQMLQNAFVGDYAMARNVRTERVVFGVIEKGPIMVIHVGGEKDEKDSVVFNVNNNNYNNR